MTITPPPAPIYGLLPRRTKWIRLHCGALEHCDICLSQVAALLADEMDLDLALAMDKSTESYHAELSGSSCSLERARELRRLTVSACYPGADLFCSLLADADMVPEAKETNLRQPSRLPRVVKLALWWVAFLTIVTIAVAA